MVLTGASPDRKDLGGQREPKRLTGQAESEVADRLTNVSSGACSIDFLLFLKSFGHSKVPGLCDQPAGFGSVIREKFSHISSHMPDFFLRATPHGLDLIAWAIVPARKEPACLSRAPPHSKNQKQFANRRKQRSFRQPPSNRHGERIRAAYRS